MRIFIDIGHPAHVHYFRNFISIMRSRGHRLFVSARDKEVAHELLRAYGVDFASRGKGKAGHIRKFLYIFEADWILLGFALRFKPDLFLSFASPYAAHASRLLGRPHITFDDTEHARLNHYLYGPFTDVILSPSSYYAPFSKKQLFFDAFMEMCYLHPKYFIPNRAILSKLRILSDQKYVVFRFVSWKANHDFGLTGMSDAEKRKLVADLSRYAKVFISSESSLPNDLERYRITAPPEDFHHILAYADLCISEGSTTASECSVLGTPSIYVNRLQPGTNSEQEKKYKICHTFHNLNGVFEKAVDLLNNVNLKHDIENAHRRLLSDKIIPTDFMVWFVESYPKSVRIMKEDPQFQYHFRSQIIR